MKKCWTIVKFRVLPRSVEHSPSIQWFMQQPCYSDNREGNRTLDRRRALWPPSPDPEPIPTFQLPSRSAVAGAPIMSGMWSCVRSRLALLHPPELQDEQRDEQDLPALRLPEPLKDLRVWWYCKTPLAKASWAPTSRRRGPMNSRTYRRRHRECADWLDFPPRRARKCSEPRGLPVQMLPFAQPRCPLLGVIPL